MAAEQKNLPSAAEVASWNALLVLLAELTATMCRMPSSGPSGLRAGLSEDFLGGASLMNTDTLPAYCG